MKKLLALLLSGCCILSVAACVQDGNASEGSTNGASSVAESDSGQSSAEEGNQAKTEFEKIREYLSSTSDAKNGELIYEIALANESVEIQGNFSLVHQRFDSESGQYVEGYETYDDTIAGKISCDGSSAYTAYIFSEGITLYANQDGVYVPMSDMIESGYYGVKYDGESLQFVLTDLFTSTWCANAKQIFAMNASLSENLLAQIGTTYSMTTADGITTITYSATSGEQTEGGVEFTQSARVTYTWKFNQAYRCIEFTESYESVYKTEVAASAGRTNGSRSYSVRASTGGVSMPSNLDSYYYMGSLFD